MEEKLACTHVSRKADVCVLDAFDSRSGPPCVMMLKQDLFSILCCRIEQMYCKTDKAYKFIYKCDKLLHSIAKLRSKVGKPHQQRAFDLQLPGPWAPQQV